MKRLALLVIVGWFAQLVFPGSAYSAPQDSVRVKELNFVLLHGAGGNTCSFQLLEDFLTEQLPKYILSYEEAHPDTKVQVNILKRCYPGYVDVRTWAINIADSIARYFPDKENLILVGHSMGGKSALYAVARDIGGLADRVATVVTINSPIKSLNRYYVTGGGSAAQYCRARWLLSDEGICQSVATYDSSQDGSRVAGNQHWLAFVSGESAPLSEQFDIGGIDGFPRNIDDSIVPLSAQYADGADVIYYGEYGHSDFTVRDEVAEFIADRILRYLFGEVVECSVMARGGIFDHEAGWLPGRDYWEDVVGGVPASSDIIVHQNDSYFRWQEWEDVVGDCPPGTKRDSYYVSLVDSLPWLTSIEEVRWLSPDDAEDCRLYLRTRAAPRSRVQVNWSIHQQGLLPVGFGRGHYEVEIVTGTPLTKITQVSWATEESGDLRLKIGSEAERPFRWFKAEWRVYFKEGRQRRVIDEIPGQLLGDPVGN